MTTIDTRTAQSITVYFYLRDKFKLVLTVTDQDGDAVDLSAKTLVFSIRDTEGGTALTTIDGADITVSGTDSNVVTIEKEVTGLSERSYYIDLDNTTDNNTIVDGLLIATYQGR